LLVYASFRKIIYTVQLLSARNIKELNNLVKYLLLAEEIRNS